MRYVLDINFILDAITDRSKYKKQNLAVLEHIIFYEDAYISSSSLHNIRFVLRRFYKDYYDKYLILEKNLKIAKTPSYCNYNDKTNKMDIEDYLVELSAKAIDAYIITTDKKFLETSTIAMSPEEYILNTISNNKKIDNIDFANLKKQYFLYQPEFEQEMDKVLNSAKYIMGDLVKQLEENLAKFTDSKYVIACGNGTDALILSLMAIGIKPEDEVITTPFTFIATAEAIALIGAKPVFVDIDEKTYNIDVNKIEEKITPKTKAIIPVSLYGQPADLDKIQEIAKKYNLKVIVDGAQSFGATYKGKSEVHYCDIYTTSFFPAKPLGCFGDGGAIFTNNEELAKKIRSLRVHGQTKRYYHKYIGMNSRLDTLQAVVLNVKLKHYPEDLKKRQEVAEKYTNLLKNNDKIIYPIVRDNRTSTWAQYSIRVKNRDKLQLNLKEAGIPTSIHYPMPLHLQECFRYLGYKEGDFPVAEKVSKEILSLPMNPYLSDEEIKYIVDTIKNAE